MTRSGYTGRLFEEEVLLRCHFSWKGYVPFRESERLVEANQPWDPADPSTRGASDLHTQVAMALELENWDELRLFSALKTPLDVFHGIDAFFEWQGWVVTLDLTCDPHKENCKADFMIRPEDSDDDWKHVGCEIARLLKQGAFAA